MRRRSAPAIGAGALAVAMVAACSSGTEDDSAEPSGEYGPLAEYVGSTVSFSGVGFGLPFAEDSPVLEPSEEEQQQVRRFEETVAECMANEGFEYVPAPGDGGELSAFEEAGSLSQEEFVEQHGYGITLLYLDPAGEEAADPNQEIRESLSPEARDAYEAALLGEGWQISDDGGLVIQEQPTDGESPTPPGGCQEQARQDVYGAEESMLSEVTRFEALFDDVFQLYQRVENEPRVAEAAEAWAACMADGGYPGFEKVSEARQSISTRIGEVMGVAPPPEAEDDLAAQDTGTGDAPGAADAEAIEDVRDEELALAAVDYECQQEHYADVHREVSHELEAEFVEQHRSALERYRDYRARDLGGGD